jgi:glucosamine-6-phosphate deaminase
MRIIYCKDADEVASANLAEIKRVMSEAGNLFRGFFPTGQSPLKTYQRLTQDDSIFRGQTKIEVIQIDEFYDHTELFKRDLHKNLLEPLEAKSIAILTKFWGPRPSGATIFNHIENILSREIDLAMLGLGPNGHVGFHEPWCGGRTFMGGLVRISGETRLRVKGAESSVAVTFGVGSFLRARNILLTVTGEEKCDIFKRFLKEPESQNLPATFLKSHANIVVTTDLNI